MPFVTPGTVVAGDVLTAARYNSDVVANTQYLKSEADKVGLVHINTTSFTSSTSIVPGTAVFSSDYESYVIALRGTSTSASSVNVEMKLRDGSTSASSGYGWMTLGINDLGTTSNSSGTGNTGMFCARFSGSSGQGYSFLTLSAPFLAQPTFLTLSFSYFESTTGGRGTGFVGNAYHGTVASYDRFEIIPGGTSTGVVRVYGVRPS
jgi:hypothetical protein